MARVVPADKRLPDDDFERLNIGNRTYRHRAVNPLCFARRNRQQIFHAGCSGSFTRRTPGHADDHGS
jgi:hypothetical protein